MANTVIGLFEKKENAMEARRQLLNNGFTESQIDFSSQGKMEGQFEGKDEDENAITRFFKSIFGSSDEADNYSEVAKRGTVVTVHTDTMTSAELAADILDQYGAVNANEMARSYRNQTTADRDLTKDNADELAMKNKDAEIETEASIPVIEENLEIGKRVVETGGIRARSMIIERPVEEHLRLREEHVSVERNPVNREATAADLESFKEGTIETTEHSEVPVVGKEARVVEEVKIKKEVKERDETIRGSVRRQDVNIEKKKKSKKTTGSENEEDL
jgi:stress response protein YsnF